MCPNLYYTRKYGALRLNLCYKRYVHYVRTYVTHENIVHYVPTCVARQNIFCPNICYTRKYGVLPPNPCNKQKYFISELMLPTNIWHIMAQIVLQTETSFVQIYDTHENVEYYYPTYVTNDMYYVRTYVTHENIVHYVPTCVARQNIFCPNICYTRKYGVLPPNPCNKQKYFISELMLPTNIWHIMAQIVLQTETSFVRHMVHTKMWSITSQHMKQMNLFYVRTYVTHEYKVHYVSSLPACLLA